MASDPDDIERRVRAGAWVLPGEAATLLGVHRDTVSRMLAVGKIKHRPKSGAGQRPYRECDPETLLGELAKRRTVHGAGEE